MPPEITANQETTMNSMMLPWLGRLFKFSSLFTVLSLVIVLFFKISPGGHPEEYVVSFLGNTLTEYGKISQYTNYGFLPKELFLIVLALIIFDVTPPQKRMVLFKLIVSLAAGAFGLSFLLVLITPYAYGPISIFFYLFSLGSSTWLFLIISILFFWGLTKIFANLTYVKIAIGTVFVLTSIIILSVYFKDAHLLAINYPVNLVPSVAYNTQIPIQKRLSEITEVGKQNFCSNYILTINRVECASRLAFAVSGAKFVTVLDTNYEKDSSLCSTEWLPKEHIPECLRRALGSDTTTNMQLIKTNTVDTPVTPRDSQNTLGI